MHQSPSRLQPQTTPRFAHSSEMLASQHPNAELLLPLQRRARAPAHPKHQHCQRRDAHTGCFPQGQEKQACWGHLKYFFPLLRTHLRGSKRVFSARVPLSNGKRHLETLKRLWERMHVEERIQRGGHESALWILGTAEEELRPPPFLCSCSMLCRDCEGISPLTAERSSRASAVPKLRG